MDRSKPAFFAIFANFVVFANFANFVVFVNFVIFVVVFCTAASAQTFSVGVETARDRITYHFENPSSFDTAQPVPHFFEQRYVTDNLWLVASARYTAAIPWESSVAVTLDRSLPATDYDTFLDPDGTVIVSGTSGDAVIHSLRVSQRGELGRAGPLVFLAGYSLRLDWADFLVGHKTVTLNGRVAEALDVTTPEMTSSLIQEFFFGAKAGRPIGSGWRVTVAGEAAPTTMGRLRVELPEKYPGEQFDFGATSFTGTARVAFTRAPNRRPVEVAIDVVHAWHYTTENSLTRDRVAARLLIGL